MDFRELEYIHVVKKLKQILGSWWNAEVLFFNENHVCDLKSLVESDKALCFNPIFKELLSKEKLIQALANTLGKSLEEISANKSSYAFKEWEEVGSDVLIYPIHTNNELMGSIVVIGFLKDSENKDDRLSKIRSHCLEVGVSSDLVEDYLSKIRDIKEHERSQMVGLVKLISDEILTLYTEVSTRKRRLLELNSADSNNSYSYNGLIGRSKPMQELYNLLEKIKNAESTIIIQGENGTGKELIAKAIHRTSSRGGKPFVIQNCSAFNDNLLESELFGHAKGAFTGAIKDKKGLFLIADQGTFFLDEIGDTSPSMQVKLLRVLQEGTFLPVGSTETKKVDVRIVAATNKNLKEMVDKGLFREDLYYRLNVINVQAPSLRERKEDIPLLVDHFLTAACKNKLQEPKVFDRSIMQKFYDYNWPGNVRELENEVERLVVLAGDSERISASFLSPKIAEFKSGKSISPVFSKTSLKDAIEELEREMIQDGLRRTGWNKSRLAKELGISRASLITKVEKYALDKRKAGGTR